MIIHGICTSRIVRMINNAKSRGIEGEIILESYCMTPAEFLDIYRIFSLDKKLNLEDALNEAARNISALIAKKIEFKFNSESNELELVYYIKEKT